MLTAITRTVILYLLIIIGIRLMGKRQIGQLEPSELVLSLIIADIAAVPMQDFGIPLVMGVAPILTLLCLSTILSVLTVKSLRFRALLCGRPSVVVRDGEILFPEMEKNRFTVDELMEELRVSGVTDLSKVKCAILETTGRISVIPTAEEQPVTAKDLGLNVTEYGLPIVLISDGRIVHRNLNAQGLSEKWLKQQLAVRNVEAKDVYLLTVDEKRRVYCAQKGETP